MTPTKRFSWRDVWMCWQESHRTSWADEGLGCESEDSLVLIQQFTELLRHSYLIMSRVCTGRIERRPTSCLAPTSVCSRGERRRTPCHFCLNCSLCTLSTFMWSKSEEQGKQDSQNSAVNRRSWFIYLFSAAALLHSHPIIHETHSRAVLPVSLCIIHQASNYNWK